MPGAAPFHIRLACLVWCLLTAATVSCMPLHAAASSDTERAHVAGQVPTCFTLHSLCYVTKVDPQACLLRTILQPLKWAPADRGRDHQGSLHDTPRPLGRCKEEQGASAQTIPARVERSLTWRRSGCRRRGQRTPAPRFWKRGPGLLASARTPRLSDQRTASRCCPALSLSSGCRWRGLRTSPHCWGRLPSVPCVQ
jgi:hypothetical protein